MWLLLKRKKRREVVDQLRSKAPLEVQSEGLKGLRISGPCVESGKPIMSKSAASRGDVRMIQ